MRMTRFGRCVVHVSADNLSRWLDAVEKKRWNARVKVDLKTADGVVTTWLGLAEIKAVLGSAETKAALAGRRFGSIEIKAALADKQIMPRQRNLWVTDTLQWAPEARLAQPANPMWDSAASAFPV